MLLLTWALALVLAANDPPEPVAMVLSVKGDMKLRRMDLVRSGEEVRVPCPGELRLVFLTDGHKETIQAGVTVRITGMGATPAEGVRREAGPVPRSQLEGLRTLAASARSGVSRIRDLDAPPLPFSPIDGSIVPSDRPSFAWTSAHDVGECEIQLFRGETDRQENRLWSIRVRKSHAEYPRDRQALARGESYTWRVSTLGQDVLAKGSFAVATAEEAGAFESIRILSRSPDTSNRLLAAMLLEAGQVYDESNRLYEALAKELPAEPWVLLASARHLARAGRTEEARNLEKKARALVARSR